MKQIVGTDVGSYAFDTVENTITLSGLETLNIEQILLIINVQNGVNATPNFFANFYCTLSFLI